MSAYASRVHLTPNSNQIEQVSLRLWHLADIDFDPESVRYGGKADISSSGAMSANHPKRILALERRRTWATTAWSNAPRVVLFGHLDVSAC
jgi:hypothetical protein